MIKEVNSVPKVDHPAPLTIQSLSRGLHLLELIAKQPDGCSVKCLSQDSGITLSTCYHLVSTLDEMGYIEKDQRTLNYVATYKVSYLHHLVQRKQKIPSGIMSIAAEIADKTGETAYVAVWDTEEIIIKYIVEGDQAVKVRSLYVGYRDHVFVRALGKAVLAHVSQRDLLHFRKTHAPQRRTPFSKVEWADIEQELQFTRERGFSADEQEFDHDVCCLGVPIFYLNGEVWGALSISMPRSRYQRDDVTIAYLKHQGEIASLELVYPPSRAGSRKIIES